MKKNCDCEKKRRIGILGGSFDPVHVAHIKLAQAAYGQLGLDKIIFMPARQAALKDAPVKASAQQRLEMLRIALKNADFPYEIDLSEFSRSGISYTIDTVREILKKNSDLEIFWIIGGDHLSKIHEWKQSEQLCKLVTFACAERGGIETSIAQAPTYAHIVPIDFRPIDISSTRLREDLKKAETTNLKLDPAVLQYILQNKLYL